MQQAGGEIKPPPHPSGVGAASAINPLHHRQTVDQVVDPPVPIRTTQVIQVPLELEQLPARQDLVDRHLLSHVTKQSADRPGIREGINTGHLHRPLIGPQKCGQDPHGRGLAGSVGPKKTEQTGLRHRQREIPQGLHSSVGLVKLSQFNQCHSAT